MFTVNHLQKRGVFTPARPHPDQFPTLPPSSTIIRHYPPTSTNIHQHHHRGVFRNILILNMIRKMAVPFLLPPLRITSNHSGIYKKHPSSSLRATTALVGNGRSPESPNSQADIARNRRTRCPAVVPGPARPCYLSFPLQPAPARTCPAPHLSPANITAIKAHLAISPNKVASITFPKRRPQTATITITTPATVRNALVVHFLSSLRSNSSNSVIIINF